MAELYKLNAVVQRFGEREVLNIPALTLESGKIYGLLGPNGAGKTTLMRLLAFMDIPAEGSISFMGKAVQPDQSARYRARVVWVPQSPVMFTGSLLYNIEYPMRLRKVPRQERRKRALELLQSVDLLRLSKAPAHKLSGGEAQRASIARALAAGAEVILFDEPTASVDFRSRGEIIGIIKDLHDSRGLSLIVTTHDADLASELCQEKISLFDGRLSGETAFSGKPVSVTTSRTSPAGCNREPVPAKITLRDGSIQLWFIQPETQSNFEYFPEGTELVVSGLMLEPEGTHLRLRSPSDSFVEVHVASEESAKLAQELTLGSKITIIPAPEH